MPRRYPLANQRALLQRTGGRERLREALPPSWNRARQVYRTSKPQFLGTRFHTPKRFCFGKPRRLPHRGLSAASAPQRFALIQYNIRPSQWEVPLIALATGKRER